MYSFPLCIINIVKIQNKTIQDTVRVLKQDSDVKYKSELLC